MYGSIYSLRTEAFMKENRTGVNATGNEQTVSAGVEFQSWKDFFVLVHSVDVPDDFMAERPMNLVPPGRGVFDM
jgi:antitoxin VapB